MTPYELGLHAEVFGDRLQQERDEKLTLVWLGEYFHRIDKLPPLKEVLETKEKEVMTDEQMMEVAKQLTTALGGTVVERKESE